MKAFGKNITDHGELLGLGDDDHTQYHTDARALTWLGTRSTTDLSEGSNLYYTEARVSANTDVAASKAITDFITVTGPADLDQMQLDIAALDAAITLQGTWDASVGTFPGGGTAQAGYSYIVSVGGTVDGEVFTANDRIVAITDNASTSTYSGNWHKLDYTDQVLSVAGKTGAVTLVAADITDLAGGEGIGLTSGVIDLDFPGLTATTSLKDSELFAVYDSGDGGSHKKVTMANVTASMIPLTTQGDILYHNGTGLVRLAKGSNGQVLSSTATNPAWITNVAIPANNVTSDGGPFTVNELVLTNNTTGTIIGETGIIGNGSGGASFGNVDINTTANRIESSSGNLELNVPTDTEFVHIPDRDFVVDLAAFTALGYTGFHVDVSVGRTAIGRPRGAAVALGDLFVPNLGSAIAALMNIEAGNGNAGLTINSAAAVGSFQNAGLNMIAGTGVNQQSYFFGCLNNVDFGLGGAFIIADTTAGLSPRVTIANTGRVYSDGGFVEELVYNFHAGQTLGTAGNFGAEGGLQVNLAQGTAATDDTVIQGGTDTVLFVVDASADTVHVGSALTADGAKFFVDGKASISQELEVNGAFNHDGLTVGFYGVAPVTRAAAYTVTNLTADRTYDANATTVAELADVLGTLIGDLRLLGLVQ